MRLCTSTGAYFNAFDSAQIQARVARTRIGGQYGLRIEPHYLKDRCGHSDPHTYHVLAESAPMALSRMSSSRREPPRAHAVPIIRAPPHRLQATAATIAAASGGFHRNVAVEVASSGLATKKPGQT